MLLGIDFMQEHGVQLHCSTGEFRVGASLTIQPMCKANPNSPSMQAVSVRRVRLPPLSVVVIDCGITDEILEFILEPLDKFSVWVISSRSFNKSETRGELWLMNLTPRAHIFRQGQPFATAALATEVGIPEASVRQIRTESSSKVPSHIEGILDDIRINALPGDEAVGLITQYSDVFAVCDLDLGEFAAIEHHIETGEARPVKQRMRRTPVVFQGEEKGHLDRMLAAGLIPPSTDGSVRWCIGYRALNKVTVIYTYPFPLIEECLNTLAGNLWFSKLDANAAYWQIKVSPRIGKDYVHN
ncbi:uncharacterized protein LOC128162302 [Crassostrea angulata]|uniref:uncharacterized protein LOC128162302 n=1 Tax=Magallana angulata TaxID=2784310 RepID=UPI0022B0E3C0|nr:uncharacterized protein LOC128162302 [Crassostrea angulata]